MAEAGSQLAAAPDWAASMGTYVGCMFTDYGAHFRNLLQTDTLEWALMSAVRSLTMVRISAPFAN